MQDTCYIIKNQHGQFISKQKEWLDGSEPKLLFKTPNHDEAINWVFELSLKDTELRALAENCELDEKGVPIVDVTYQQPIEWQTTESSDNSESHYNENQNTENLTADDNVTGESSDSSAL